MRERRLLSKALKKLDRLFISLEHVAGFRGSFLTSSKHPVEYQCSNVTLKHIIARFVRAFISEREAIVVQAHQKSNQPLWWVECRIQLLHIRVCIRSFGH